MLTKSIPAVDWCLLLALCTVSQSWPMSLLSTTVIH